MEYLIALLQIILFITFVFTLKCELSKEYSDSVISVSLRAFIMCASAAIFFMLFDNKQHNLTSISMVFIPIIVGIFYAILEKIINTNFKYQKGT